MYAYTIQDLSDVYTTKWREFIKERENGEDKLFYLANFSETMKKLMNEMKFVEAEFTTIDTKYRAGYHFVFSVPENDTHFVLEGKLTKYEIDLRNFPKHFFETEDDGKGFLKYLMEFGFYDYVSSCQQVFDFEPRFLISRNKT